MCSNAGLAAMMFKMLEADHGHGREFAVEIILLCLVVSVAVMFILFWVCYD